jgi:hypothetical protein
MEGRRHDWTLFLQSGLDNQLAEKLRIVMGLGMVVDRRLPTSSRTHESSVWQGLYRLEVELVWILRGATGR